jgi:site-specific DNA-methyltransferase (adenine-specific)
LFYSKSSQFTWTDPRGAHESTYVDNHFRNVDIVTQRRFQAISLTGAGIRTGDSGKPWKGIDPTLVGRHWAVPNDALSRIGAGRDGSTQDKLDALDRAGLVYWPSKEGGTPRLKQFADELDGAALSDIWIDIAPISAQAAERLGYPTQKPLALLERIIAASSNEGDVVLDPFCGCGTAVHAAQKLGRRWIGIDITHLAVSLIERRLKDAFPGIAFEVHGTPTDIAAARDLAERDKHQFQLWACGLVNAQPYQGGRKGADRGIDGLRYIEVGKGRTEKVIVQVKGGASVTRANIATLKGDVDREKAAIGLFVTLAEPTREMTREANAAGHYESPFHGAVAKIQILTIEELLGGRKPELPDLSRGAQTFKKATLEQGDGKKQQSDLGF